MQEKRPCSQDGSDAQLIVKTGFYHSFNVLAILLGINQAAAQDMVCAAGTVLQGADVYAGNGSINWTNVSRAGVVFAYARATDGDAVTDTLFSANWPGMKAAGIVRGAFAAFEPDQNGTIQANYFLSVMGTLEPGDLPPMLEVDVTDGESAATITANITDWVNNVKAATGRVPIIYTSEGFWNSDVTSTAFSAYPLWIANYGVACPTLAEGWTNWVIWQNSDSGTVSGIGGAVDLDEFNGAMSDIQAFANPPSLDIALTGTNEISVTWSTFAIGYGLQQNPNLGTTNWVSVTNTPSVVSNREQVVLATSTNHVYLRLFHP
jgi:lysozyme